MKRLLAGAATSTMLLLAAAGPASAGPQHDFASGAGWAGEFAQFEFTAQRNGQLDVKGQGSFKVPGMERVHFDVECLEVDGNRATLGGPPREDFFGAQFILFDVEDNGPASAGADQMTPRFSGVPATNNCTTFAFSDPLVPVARGNVLVRDGTP